MNKERLGVDPVPAGRWQVNDERHLMLPDRLAFPGAELHHASRQLGPGNHLSGPKACFDGFRACLPAVSLGHWSPPVSGSLTLLRTSSFVLLTGQVPRQSY